MAIRKVLAIACVFVFILYILWANPKRKAYLLFVLYVLPLVDLAVTPESQGGFSVFDIASYVGLLLFARELKFSSQRNIGYLLIFLLMMSLLFFGAIESEFVNDSLVSFFKFLPVFIYTKALIDEMNESPEFTGTVIKAMRTICLVSVAFLAIQMVVGVKFSFYGSLNTNVAIESSVRFPSFFQDPQKYAQFLSMTSFLFLIKTDETDTTQKNFLYFFVVVMAMFLTGARAAFGGFVVGLAIVYLIGEGKYRTVAIVAGLLGYLIIILFGEYFPLFNRGESAAESYEFRNQIWQEALEIHREHASLGIGIGNYRSYVEVYAQDQFWYMGDGEILYFDHPESGYLKMLTEYGRAAFGLLCLFIVLPFFNALRRYVLGLTDGRIFYSIGAIIAWMISYITVYSLSDTRVLIPLITHICLLITADNRKIETS
jgi:O-antigen ligase